MSDITTLMMGAAGAGGGAETDPNFNQTTLLLHGDGTNGAQNNTFLDSSSNTFTITRNGNTTQGTFSPFSVADGEWSNYFDGTSDNLSVANNAAFQFGTGDFTVEAWVYQTVQRAEVQVIVKCAADQTWNTGWALALGTSNSVVSFWVNGSNVSSSGASTVTLNGWSHVAVSRSGTTLKMFINGVEVDSDTNSTSIVPTVALTVGADITSSTYELQGYISNVRLVKGRAVYTSAFTPPTSPLGVTSGGDDPPQGTETSLLTCQSNRFVDNSTNTFAITVNGNTSVQPFSPFAPSAAYSTSVNGGSGYFDGSGDYLSVASNAALGYGTGDFTIECFYYPTSTASYFFIDQRGSNSLYILGNSESTTGFSTNVFGTRGTSNLNAWNHFVLSRVSGTAYMFINGVQIGSSASDGTNYGTAGANIGASYIPSNYFTGYISNFRIVKGVGVTSVTVPTTPLTSDANTSLLLNFTNTGIFDNTGKNNLETFGNAQIDTSVKKYGTGSMEFDGTGDYLLMNGGTNFVFGTGDFTIEFWVNTNQTVNEFSVVDFRSTNGFFPFIAHDSTRGVFYYLNSGYRIESNTVLTTGIWYHIAVARSGSSTKLFIDGTQAGSTYTNSNSLSVGANRPAIGVNGANVATLRLDGYIDDLRITKGVARYTTTFTPPTAAFPDL